MSFVVPLPLPLARRPSPPIHPARPPASQHMQQTACVLEPHKLTGTAAAGQSRAARPAPPPPPAAGGTAPPAQPEGSCTGCQPPAGRRRCKTDAARGAAPSRPCGEGGQGVGGRAAVSGQGSVGGMAWGGWWRHRETLCSRRSTSNPARAARRRHQLTGGGSRRTGRQAPGAPPSQAGCAPAPGSTQGQPALPLPPGSASDMAGWWPGGQIRVAGQKGGAGRQAQRGGQECGHAAAQGLRVLAWALCLLQRSMAMLYGAAFDSHAGTRTPMHAQPRPPRAANLCGVWRADQAYHAWVVKLRLGRHQCCHQRCHQHCGALLHRRQPCRHHRGRPVERQGGSTERGRGIDGPAWHNRREGGRSGGCEMGQPEGAGRVACRWSRRTRVKCTGGSHLAAAAAVTAGATTRCWRLAGMLPAGVPASPRRAAIDGLLRGVATHGRADGPIRARVEAAMRKMHASTGGFPSDRQGVRNRAVRFASKYHCRRAGT